MKKMFVCLSHGLTEDQIKDAKKSLSVTDFIYPSDELKLKTSNVSAEASISDVMLLVDEVLNQAADCDVFLLQGEPTLMVHSNILAASLGKECVTSTTERVSVEKIENGKCLKTSVFKHVQFRPLFLN